MKKIEKMTAKELCEHMIDVYSRRFNNSEVPATRYKNQALISKYGELYNLADENEKLMKKIYELKHDAISIEWIREKLTEYVCNGKYSSDQLPIVYTLIHDWRKEND